MKGTTHESPLFPHGFATPASCSANLKFVRAPIKYTEDDQDNGVVLDKGFNVQETLRLIQ